MTLQAPNLNYLWTSTLIEELVRNGANYFCIAPGSRSAPLAVAAAQNKRARTLVHFDERGLAFHALGYSRASGKPAVIITTSGTAVANLFPAIIEASEENIPLMILTADRPYELRDTRANQTIDQVKIFGNYVRWHCDLSCPEPDIAIETLLTTVDQACAQATGFHPGPVHLNLPFREPLDPFPRAEEEYITLPGYLESYWNSNQPYTRSAQSIRELDEPTREDLTARFKHTERGLIVVGSLKNSEEIRAAIQIISALGWPAVADITSGLRLSEHESVIHYVDALLIHSELWDRLKPTGVLHLGGRITSKRLLEFLKFSRPEFYVCANNSAFRHDPNHHLSHRINMSVSELKKSVPTLEPNPLWSNIWRALNQRVAEVFNSYFESHSETLTEPWIARAISSQAPAESALFLASSMPVRDAETFGAVSTKKLRICANRGASGIDGTLATACGFSAGHTQEGAPTTVLLGDLAFLHDLNSLSLIRQSKHPIVAVVINNDGGGIFSFLPISKHKDAFEKLFGTPHGYRFKGACESFQVPYVLAADRDQFLRAYAEAFRSNQSRVIEVITNRQENFDLHQEIKAQIVKNLEEV